MYEFAAATQAAFLFAQAAPDVVVPAAPVVVTEPTTVIVPYGEYLSLAVQWAGVALMGLVTWGFRFLPAQVNSLLMTMRVDQLLSRAIEFGVNSVAGATKDKVLTLDVSNAVLRQALTYALVHGGQMVKEFAGGPTDIAEKLWARLDVAPDVGKPNFAQVALQTADEATLTKAKRAKEEDDKA